MNGIIQRDQWLKTHSPGRTASAHRAERWAREELNLRPHAYQPTNAATKVRHHDTISLMDGAICRDAPAALPHLAGNNGRHNGQHSVRSADAMRR